MIGIFGSIANEFSLNNKNHQRREFPPSQSPQFRSTQLASSSSVHTLDRFQCSGQFVSLLLSRAHIQWDKKSRSQYNHGMKISKWRWRSSERNERQIWTSLSIVSWSQKQRIRERAPYKLYEWWGPSLKLFGNRSYEHAPNNINYSLRFRTNSKNISQKYSSRNGRECFPISLIRLRGPTKNVDIFIK